MSDAISTWADIERQLSQLPRWAVTEFAARSARRSLPAVAALEPAYGPEALEWAATTEATIETVEAFVRGHAVTRFRLDLAADAARCAANATANAARTLGPSPLIEAAELAYAAAAYAADAARAPNDARAMAFAVKAAQMAANGGDPTAEQVEDVRQLSRSVAG